MDTGQDIGRSGPPRLQLLGGFALFHGAEVVPVPPGSQRVLALVALAPRRTLSRATVRGTVWPDATERHARANLRTALWRLARCCVAALAVDGERLSLAPAVALDVTDPPATTGLGNQELLPGWDDEWLVPERERVRQLRLHVLEETARQLITERRFGEAIDLAYGAVAVEPLRESGHRLLIEAHLAEGNLGEALLQYESCRRLLADELGVPPSRSLSALVSQPWSHRDVAVTA